VKDKAKTAVSGKLGQDIPVPISVSREPSIVPISVPRAPSIASTVAYDDQFRAESKIRDAVRSRSRHADDIVPDARRPILPLQSGEQDRGRSPTNKIEKIANQIAKTQNRALVKGQIRHQLGRFASNMAAKQREAAPTRAVSAQPAKRPVKTFDDIINITEPREEQIVKRKELPFGATLQKQRLDSRGIARERFGGRLVA